jgi:hypothetical protein
MASGLSSGCDSGREEVPIRLTEQPIRQIQLAGEMTQRHAEISGLAWCEEQLVLLPQFPEWFGHHLFVIPKARIIAYLDGEDPRPITPQAVAFTGSAEAEAVPGFDGYEAIGFHDRRAYLTIETKGDEANHAYLVSGTMADGFKQFSVDAATLVAVPHQVTMYNVSDEALIVIDDRVGTIHEVNGANVNPNPVVHLFDLQLQPQGTIAFPIIEYRVTDASAPDSSGRFWVVNYLYTRDLGKLKPGQDYWFTHCGTGVTHAARPAVERLLELQYTGHSIERTDSLPILLRLAEGDTCRNWEGLARLDERGFLLVTDEYPETILAFVAQPAYARVDSLPAASATAH